MDSALISECYTWKDKQWKLGYWHMHLIAGPNKVTLITAVCSESDPADKRFPLLLITPHYFEWMAFPADLCNLSDNNLTSILNHHLKIHGFVTESMRSCRPAVPTTCPRVILPFCECESTLWPWGLLIPRLLKFDLLDLPVNTFLVEVKKNPYVMINSL